MPDNKTAIPKKTGISEKKEQIRSCQNCVFCNGYAVISKDNEKKIVRVQCNPHKWMGDIESFEIPESLMANGCVRFRGTLASWKKKQAKKA